ncbi:MFS transporter [Salinibacterium sp. ZJ70]|uniref:MFS transporter n=1 Tax=Salinibacterium sp. ZJ70 TaxID=2708084 RepID=UPI001421D6FB|nr:MFS transporter [Salinibacterium sp. ZJ70]
MSALPARTRLGYAAGSIASGTYGTVPGLLMLPYLTDTLGVEAALAGLIVFAPKAWDFVVNPIAGRASDGFARHGDPRRPFVLWAGVGMALAFTAMFLGPVSPTTAGALWVVGFLLVAATGFAFFQVPYIALGAELTADPHVRTRLMSGRVIVLTTIILGVGATAPLLVEAVGRPEGYRVMAIVMGALIALGAVLLWWGTRGAPRARTHAPRGSFIAQLRIVLADQRARWLVLVFVLQGVAMTMVLAGIAYFARHVLGVPTATAIIFAGCVAPALLVTPLWSRISARIGAVRGLRWASVSAASGLALMILAALSGNLVVLLIASVVLGIGYSGAQLFPLAMLAELAADDERRTGENRIGLIAGVWSGIDLLGSALGPAVFGIVLSLGGYLESTGTEVVQSDAARVAIVVGLAVLPAALFAASLLPLTRFASASPARDASSEVSTAP